MLIARNSVRCTIMLFCCCTWLVGCNAAATTATTSATPTSTRATTAIVPTQVPTPVPTKDITPAHFTSRVILQGSARPDDLVFDGAENILLFSDVYSGTIDRVTLNGQVTVVLRGIAGPEGLIELPDRTLIIAEQNTNRILILPPGATTPSVLRVLPGKPGPGSCQHGVDAIAWDATTNTIIVPDSPTGDVYRLSLDGKSLTLLASGIVRPVGAAVDRQGNIYVADECGGAVWRISNAGVKTRIGGFGMPDDVALDTHGNLLVVDLAIPVHALIRLNLQSGKREVIASRGYIEPQGLLVDTRDDIFVSDDYANKIVEYLPA